MRKHIRAIMRHQAQEQHVKPSKWVKYSWNKYQVDKVGKVVREVNKARGTHPKKTWPQRYTGVV